MSDIVTISGPFRHWVEPWTDPGDGVVSGGYWTKMIMADARGTDGNVYGMSFSYDDKVDPAFLLEAGKAGALRCLEGYMRQLGVWPEDGER